MKRILLSSGRVLLLGALFLFSRNNADAVQGRIHGTVSGNGGPIVGATVRLLEFDRTTYTDAHGIFVFPDLPRGTYSIFARVIGYASATNRVVVGDTTAETSVRLHESAIEGEEIVVSASPYARPADDQYQSAEAKSMVEFHQSSGSSFAEKISDLPGVTVRSDGSTPSRPILRGLSDNRVLVLENGLRTGDISTYDPAHAVPIEAASISQIDVVRGPASILYGPSTIGGLVNVITNTIPSASIEPFSGSVSVSGNSVSDEYTGYFNGVYSGSGHAVAISAGGLHAQDIRVPSGMYVDPASGKGFELSRMPQTFDRAQETGIGYSYEGNFGMIGIGGKHFEMDYGIPGVPPNADWTSVPPTTSRITQHKNLLEMRSLYVINGSVIREVKLNADYVDYTHSEFPTLQDSSGISDPQANHFHKQAVNATLQFQHQKTGRFQGTVGLWTNIENLTIEGDQPLGPNSLTTGLAAYLFEEYLAADNARLQAGIRYDYNRIHTTPYAASLDSVFQTLDVGRQSNAVTASFGAIEKLTPELTATLSVARSFRAPTVQELFANGLDAASATYSRGDAGLGPEIGFGIDASLKGNFLSASFEITPYVNIIDRYIYAFLTGDTLQAFPVRQFSSTNARLTGFEASATVQPLPNVAVRATMDYVNAEDTRRNVPLPFTPPMRGLVSLRYQDNISSAMVQWRLAARQSRLGDGDTPTAGYGVINIGSGFRIAGAGLIHTIGIYCDNLLNKEYRDNLSAVKDFLPQPARGFRLTYDLIFSTGL